MKRGFVTVVAVGSLVLPFTGSVSAASTPTVRISFAGAPEGSSVLFVGPNTAKKISPTEKSLQLPSTFKRKGEATYRFSIHFISAEGRYLGPAVFGVKGSTRWTTNIVTRSAMNLGKVTYKSPGWGKSSVKLSRGKYGRLLVGAARDGRPRGAGRIGVVFKSGVSAMGVNSTATQVCPDELDQSLGGDCDGDGVLNAVDADEDNDSVMDVADSTTKDFPAAGWPPTAGIRANLGGSGSAKTLNANINTSTLDADIDEMLGGPNASFSLAFFFNLDNTEARAYDAAWVDCGELEYCHSTTGTATTGPTSTPMNPYFNQYYCTNVNSGGGCMEPVLWRSFLGYRVDNGVAAKVEDKVSGITNGMQFSASGEGVSWAGAMSPRGVANPRTKIKVGDPYLAKMRNATDGSVKTVPMSLGAFFVTHPAVIKVNDQPVDYTSAAPLGSRANPWIVPETGVLDMWFYRPQRTAIENSDPAGAKYMDLGGLDYGFSFEADPQIQEKVIKSRSIDSRLFGCGNKGAYTVSSPLSELSNQSGGGADLWNLHDSTTDAVPSADRMIHVVLDLKKCVQSQSSKLFVDSTRLAQDRTLELQLQAAGANTTGGRSGALQLISVQLPA
ncbi:MAG: thrombospondin type 3 repeat-containing protein, partial [Ilumatobacteraceae bacterium]